MKNLIERLWAETPVFFKRVQRICAALGAAAVIIMATGYYDVLPAWVQAMTRDMLVASVFGIILSQLTKKDQA